MLSFKMKLTNEESLRLYEDCCNGIPRSTAQSFKINKTVEVFIEKYEGSDHIDVNFDMYRTMFKNLISCKPRHPTVS